MFIASIGTASRAGDGPTLITSATYHCSSSAFHTGDGGSGFPAGRQLPGIIDESSVKGGQLIHTSAGDQGMVSFAGQVKGGFQASIKDLHGKEIIGQPCKLLRIVSDDAVTIGGQSAIDEGEGIVSIGYRIGSGRHMVEGQELVFEETANYDGAYLVDENTTATRVHFEASFSAETFTARATARAFYTLQNPLVIADGIVAPGSAVEWDRFNVNISPTPLPWSKAAVSTYTHHGPAMLFRAGGEARIVWQVFDPSGDFTVFFYFLHSLEDWEAGGTKVVMSNEDIQIVIVDSRLQVTIAHATTDAEILCPVFVRPEAFIAGRVTYESGDLQLEVFLDGTSQGTDDGVGARTMNGLDWVFGAGQSEGANFFHGGLTEVLIFDALVEAETADGYELAGLSYDEPDLFAAFDGQTFSETVTLDAGPAVDRGGGVVGFPATAHGRPAGQEVTMVGTDNYDTSVDLLPVLSSSTVDEIRIEVPGGFIAETFDGDEQALVRFALLVDQALVNSSSPLHATIKGARPATSFGGGVAAGGASESSLAGTVHPLASGPVLHKRGLQVDANDYVYLHGDPHRGEGFKRLHQKGSLTITSEELSWLALYSHEIASGEAVVDPVLNLSRLGTAIEGSVACDVQGLSPHVRALVFNGTSSFDNRGTGANAELIADYTIRMAVNAIVGTVESAFLSNREFSGEDGIRVTVSRSASTGKVILIAVTSHAFNVAAVTYEFGQAEEVSLEIAIVEEFVDVAGTTTFTFKLYVDGLLAGTDSDTIPTASLVASTQALFIGASAGFVNPDSFLKGRVSEFLIM